MYYCYKDQITAHAVHDELSFERRRVVDTLKSSEEESSNSQDDAVTEAAKTEQVVKVSETPIEN
jgi:hypothetical protein